MLKETLEIRKIIGQESHPDGFLIDLFDYKKACLDKIVEFSQNKNIAVFDYNMRKEEVKTSNFERVKSVSSNSFFDIPVVEKIYWIDIYYQEK